MIFFHKESFDIDTIKGKRFMVNGQFFQYLLYCSLTADGQPFHSFAIKKEKLQLYSYTVQYLRPLKFYIYISQLHNIQYNYINAE